MPQTIPASKALKMPSFPRRPVKFCHCSSILRPNSWAEARPWLHMLHIRSFSGAARNNILTSLDYAGRMHCHHCHVILLWLLPAVLEELSFFLLRPKTPCSLKDIDRETAHELRRSSSSEFPPTIPGVVKAPVDRHPPSQPGRACQVEAARRRTPSKSQVRNLGD